MSKHVWEVARHEPQTVSDAVLAFAYAWEDGAELDVALMFAAYCVERQRQAGHCAPRVQWERSKPLMGRANSFARGFNAFNYREAGRRMLSRLWEYTFEGFCFDEGAPLEAMLDKVRELGGFRAVLAQTYGEDFLTGMGARS